MNTRNLVAALAAFAALGFGSVASAAGVVNVQAAEFGRDGTPRVTVVKDTSADVVHAQAFGRDVPDTRVLTRNAKAPRYGDASSVLERFGRS
jgi:hypothetical protein